MRSKHTNTAIPGCGFHHLAIRTPDWDKTLKFWQEAIGFKLRVQWGQPPRRACMLDTGDGNYLEVFERDALPAGAPADSVLVHFALRADNCDAAVERARAAGAVVTVEPKTVTAIDPNIPVRIAFIKGPNGEVCEFFQSDAL